METAKFLRSRTLTINYFMERHRNGGEPVRSRADVSFHGSGLEELPAEDGTQWFSRIVTSGQLHNIAVCGDHERFEQFMRQRF